MLPLGPQVFDPERMGPERKEDVHHAKHFLTFGCGPHACVGYQYAINHMIAYAARLALQARPSLLCSPTAGLAPVARPLLSVRRPASALTRSRLLANSLR